MRKSKGLEGCCFTILDSKSCPGRGAGGGGGGGRKEGLKRSVLLSLCV